jgi:abortive infection bacteriophage resistance protein
MKAPDKRKIAAALDIRNATLVHKYLKALNVLRNHCAHNNRVWNRATVYPPGRPPERLTHPRLHHLRTCDPDRIYFLAALTAHFAVQLNPNTNWPRQFKTQARKFPAPMGMALENQMGFPTDWDANEIWHHDPAAQR